MATQIKYSFFTETGIEVPAVTADQMREIDRIATEETGPNLFQMMENAGRNLASLTMELLSDRWKYGKILVLAGTGGNGGGGICAARHLANRNVDVSLCLANSLKAGSATHFQRHIFKNTTSKEITHDYLNDGQFDLIIDALIGYSLKGAPAGTVLELIRWANWTQTDILSLDIPSGVDATTGGTPGDSIHARWTMTLALPKCGLRSGNKRDLYLADIGIPAKTYQKIGLKYTSPFDMRAVIPLITGT